MNFITRTRKLLGAVAIDPNDEDEPQQWERTGRLARVREKMAMYPYLFIAGALFCGALTLFFYPVLPSAHRSGWTLAAGIFVVCVAVSYWKGTVNAFGRLQEYELNILFSGRKIKARLGKRDGDIDDRLTGYKVLREFSRGGLKTAYEEFRDRYGRSEITEHKDKYHRAEADGSGQAVRALLKNTTYETRELEYGIDLFDAVSVTHAGEEAERLTAKTHETVTTLAPVLDKRTSSQVNNAFRAESTARKHSDQELRLVEDQLDKLEEHVDPTGQPLFERTRQLLTELGEKRHDRDKQTNSSTNPTKNDNLR